MEHTLLAPWEKLEEVPVEYLYERLRNKRNQLLAESDWTQVDDSPVDKRAWAAYRQELRDAPNNWTVSDCWIPPVMPL